MLQALSAGCLLNVLFLLFFFFLLFDLERVVGALRCGFYLLLTATPIYNSLEEAGTKRFLMPWRWKSWTYPTRALPINGEYDESRTARIWRRHYFLNRRIESCFLTNRSGVTDLLSYMERRWWHRLRIVFDTVDYKSPCFPSFRDRIKTRSFRHHQNGSKSFFSARRSPTQFGFWCVCASTTASMSLW